MHRTNKAFERYYKVELEDLRAIYQDTGEKKKAEVVRLKRKVSAG
jgi:hypothetical protein